MCQYSAKDGSPTQWHYKHLENLSETGTSMVLLESTAVEKQGKISLSDMCLYNSTHEKKLKELIKFLKSKNDIKYGIQISHSGRKGSSYEPWIKHNHPLPKKKSWKTFSASPIPRDAGWPIPTEMTKQQIKNLIQKFKSTTERANRINFDCLEVHMAHGYLLHQFFSPISNRRNDEYGGNLVNRMRLLKEIAKEVRKVWPRNKILGARITGTDHVKNGLSIKDAINDVYLVELTKVIDRLKELSEDWAAISMLARTHGQPASPTRLGKEIQVFIVRIEEQLKFINQIPNAAKFGGATGNFNAHKVAYPRIDWKVFGSNFVNQKLGLYHSFPTTQIEHYDHLASLFDCLKRINTIIIDFNRDVWSYISMDYFKQKINKKEVGSSAMPHKVNPIDFENSEWNLGLANALFEHLSSKLPVSRLQRDLTDSTVLRNVGVPFSHSSIAIKSTIKGINKLIVNRDKIENDLNNNWAVVAEAIQTILRREGYPNPYETLKELTRKNTAINQETIRLFIDTLNVNTEVKEELKKISPKNYTGI